MYSLNVQYIDKIGLASANSDIMKSSLK